ncbi:MAG: hypothetical protein ACOY3P_26235 [Planctomycetota bacterium]
MNDQKTEIKVVLQASSFVAWWLAVVLAFALGFAAGAMCAAIRCSAGTVPVPC